MKTIADVIRWLENGVEWSDGASRDAAIEAVTILKKHEAATLNVEKRLSEALSNPIFED